MAKGRLRKLAERYAIAQVEMIGDPRIVPGSMVKLEKVGEMLDGTYRVDHAHHEFSKHGYVVQFKAVRTAKRKHPRPVRAESEEQGETTWLDLRLLDETGRPVPRERYRVVTGDGRVLEGMLDDQGRAHVTGIKRETCQVSYPDLETGSWRKA